MNEAISMGCGGCFVSNILIYFDVQTKVYWRRYCIHNGNVISGLNTSPRTLPEFWISYMGAPKLKLEQAIKSVFASFFFLVLCLYPVYVRSF